MSMFLFQHSSWVHPLVLQSRAWWLIFIHSPKHDVVFVSFWASPSPHRLAQAVGDCLQVVCHRKVQADAAGVNLRANSQFLHVAVRRIAVRRIAGGAGRESGGGWDMHQQQLCTEWSWAHAPCGRRIHVTLKSQAQLHRRCSYVHMQLGSNTHKHGPGSYRQPRSAKAITCRQHQQARRRRGRRCWLRQLAILTQAHATAMSATQLAQARLFISI